MHAVRLEHIARARGLYAGGILVGVGFVGLKIYDFSNKIGAGLGLGDDFGAAYFLASGFHLLHSAQRARRTRSGRHARG